MHRSCQLPEDMTRFLDILGGEQDHFSQESSGFISCTHVVDLTRNDLPATGENGTYSGWLYNSEAIKVVQTAAEPFFLNYWTQNTHAPFEVPEAYSSLYHFPDRGLNIFNGMVSVVDESVGNVTAALKRRGIWDNTLIIYTHDNGAPLGGGGSNYPFRGGKNSNFEGGVRVPAIVSGGFLNKSRINTTFDGLVHVSDWLPTLMNVIGITSPLSDSVSSVIPYDGVSQWMQISTGTSRSPRTDIILDHCLANFSFSGTGCNHFAVQTSVGAIIMGEWKLVKGPNGGSWTNYTNGTKSSAFGPVACMDNCLFNLSSDPGEHEDLSVEYPDVLEQLLAKFENLSASYHPPSLNPPPDDKGCCHAAVASGGYLVPWKTSPEPGPPPPTPPTPPPAPLGPCVGSPGDPGWEVLNNTGGGGPGVTHFPVHDLSEASLDECRMKCCATSYCVSVVIHNVDGTYTCYLNPEHSTVAPYTRPDTILGYVKRQSYL